ncbi:SGNH/GDSL hydrolase family protein [Galbibacter sp.]|uniref:SGNH/GDSL hydrolase family protein n=1 Tax=Galbibacter sp. TaxID=2918471 RepID=UPI003A95C38B
MFVTSIILKLQFFGRDQATIGSVILGLMFVLCTSALSAQHKDEDLNWKSISEFKVFGSLNTFDNGAVRRFPDSLHKDLRERLWNLSGNTAGFYIKFKTDSPFIKVSYTPSGELSFPHMPATGVSGVDLYLKTDQGFDWVRGGYSFGKTVNYTFSHIKLADGKHEFWLYLPLYQSIADFKVGTPKAYSLVPIRESGDQNPIIVYGTSIAQGACASRAGMAWTNILGRKLPYPVVNLGFSGNGRLETEVIDYMANFKASAFVLDCMPNFTSGQGLSPEAAIARLTASITTLKKSHPNTPILIVEHAGYSDGEVQINRYHTYNQLNKATKEVYNQLKSTYDGLYLLTKEEIGLTSDSFVDGTHPNDHGMLQYAQAYEKALNELLK